jgi:hypothetical protein
MPSLRRFSKYVPSQIGSLRANGEIAEWLLNRRNRRALPHRLERCGYVSVRNPDAGDGYWVIGGSRQPVYAKASLPQQDQLRAARKLTA